MKLSLVPLFFIFNFLTFLVYAQKENNEYQVVADSIEQTLMNEDKVYFNNLMDWKLILLRGLKGIKQNSEYFDGFLSSVNKQTDLGQSLINQIKKGSILTYLKQQSANEDNVQKILFRIYDTNGGGLNYINFLIKKFPNKQYKIIDYYPFIVGEYFSESIARFYKTGLQEVMKANSNVLDNMSIFKKLPELIRNGNYKEAWTLIGNLDDEWKNQKFCWVYRIAVSQKIDNALYSKTIDEYEKRFPNDPSLYLISIDGYYLNKEYEKALDCINKLDNSIEGDVFLDFLRGNLYMILEKKDEAKKTYARFLENFPAFKIVYNKLLDLVVNDKEYEKAIQLLDKISENFDVPKNQLISLIKEEYKEFSESKIFIKWSNEN